MSFFRKMLGQEIECIVPENCFRIAYNEKIGPHYYGYIQTLEAGVHHIPKSWQITPAIPYGEHIASHGHLCLSLLPMEVYYKVTTKYRIVNPYMFMSTTYDWDFISPHLDDIIWPILYKSRKDNLQSLFADDYYLDDDCYRIACQALKKKLGIEIVSVSFKVVTREELLSVRHKESELHKSLKSDLVNIDSVFEYTANPDVNV